MGRTHYPDSLKQQVLQDYVPGTCGYKILARRYGLKRDTVRDWVLSERKKASRPSKTHTTNNPSKDDATLFD